MDNYMIHKLANAIINVLLIVICALIRLLAFFAMFLFKFLLVFY